MRQSSHWTFGVGRWTLSVCCCLLFVSCGTAPKTYLPPDSAKLKASTGRVSKAVDAAHESARKAQASTVVASALAKKARGEIAKIKNVPASVVQEMADLQSQIEETKNHQLELEQHLQEADLAKAQVEKDKLEYFGKAQHLADDATRENGKAVKAEKSLSWYRWHWWGSWIVLGIGIVLSILFAVAKFAGKLSFP